MRFILKVRFPIEAGNQALRDKKFGEKMKSLLTAINAEEAYFTTVDGQRGAYIVLNLDDPAHLPAVAEPFFLWLNADVDAHPVMTIDDLAKAGPAIGAAVEEWGA